MHGFILRKISNFTGIHLPPTDLSNTTIQVLSITSKSPRPKFNPESSIKTIHSPSNTQEFEKKQIPTFSADPSNFAFEKNSSQDAIANEFIESALTVPSSIRLIYSVKGVIKNTPYIATSNFLWLQNGRYYDARLETNQVLMGSHIQTSKGEIDRLGLKPARFSETEQGTTLAQFELNISVSSSNGMLKPTIPIQSAQDPLSVLIELGALIATNPSQFDIGTEISFQIAADSGFEQWDFVLDSLQKLNLPIGEMETLKFVHTAKDGSGTKLEVWLGRSMGYLPVQIRRAHPNGDMLEQQLLNTQTP